METLNEFLLEYSNAVANNDSAKQTELESKIGALVLLLLRRYGGRNLEEISSLLVTRPMELEYSPSEELYNQEVQDFRDALDGLRERLLTEREKIKEEHPELSATEIAAFAVSKMIWDRNRLAETTDHLWEERSKSDIADQLLTRTGFTVIKTWVAHVDSKTCPACLALNGTKIKLSENFMYNDDVITLDDHFADVANAHPHCRCRIEYSLERS